MKDRIQIDGVWYVRENEAKNLPNITKFKGMVIESDKYCFEATMLQKDNFPFDYFQDYIDIEFTDKREKPWKVEQWDNTAWMKGVLEENPDSLEILRESVCSQGEAELKSLLEEIKTCGWIEMDKKENC
jgi:hypothetical protein